MKNLFGRSVICSSETEISLKNVHKIVNGAMLRHEQNSRQIEYLEKYFTGKQSILKRSKLIRQDINNKIVINNAYSIVRNMNGYFLGEQIKLASKDADCRENVEITPNSEGKKIVKAGTIFPANNITAKDVILHDTDVTHGDAPGTIIIHGFIDNVKLIKNGIVVSDEAIEKLKLIQFVN